MDPEQILIGFLDRGIADLTESLRKLGQEADQLINSYNRLDEEIATLEQELEETKTMALVVRSN